MAFRSDSYLKDGGYRMPETQWTAMVEYARAQDEAFRRAFREDFCSRYWRPVYAYLRQMGHNAQDARDLTQGFFCDVILRRDLIRKADRSKCRRFRNYLLTAVKNYTRDLHRPLPPGVSIVPLPDAETIMPVDGINPEDAYVRQWVSGLIDSVLSDLEAYYSSHGRESHWQVFRARELWRVLGRDGPLPYTDLCIELGLEKGQAQDMLVVAKRRFRRILELKVRSMVDSDSDVEPEIRSLIRDILGLPPDPPTHGGDPADGQGESGDS